MGLPGELSVALVSLSGPSSGSKSTTTVFFSWTTIFRENRTCVRSQHCCGRNAIFAHTVSTQGSALLLESGVFFNDKSGRNADRILAGTMVDIDENSAQCPRRDRKQAGSYMLPSTQLKVFLAVSNRSVPVINALSSFSYTFADITLQIFISPADACRLYGVLWICVAPICPDLDARNVSPPLE